MRLVLAIAVVLTGCSDPSDGPDGAAPDSAIPDSAMFDSASIDVALPDAAGLDAATDATPDGPAPDAAPDGPSAPDGAPDAPIDAAPPPDASPIDAAPDATPADAGPDAAPADAATAVCIGLVEDALKACLYDLVKDHTSLTYAEARHALYDPGGIDVHDGLLTCIYTGLTAVPDGTTTPGTFNTEHSWPQSQGADVEPPKSDMHHLFPSDEAANSARSNYDFGMTACSDTPPPTCAYMGGGSELGPSTIDGSTIFEVRPVSRGDIARAHFYFAVRYQLPIPATEESVLRVWSVDDPPDDIERERNTGIAAVQGKRNPFIDEPELAGRISDF